ncbi:MAG: acyl-CoA dehydrogenase family protein [Deltaproteobacteria bacterium]|nr:acyl-CoA dehydrogenase family protein [Deltaproteobacteria bacterium]
MHFEFDENLALIRSSAREFARREILPRATEIDRSGQIPRNILQGLAELGMMGVAIPEAWGGAGATPIAYVAAMIEIAKACASTAVTMAVNNMVGEVLLRFGSEAQKERYLSKLASGQVLAASFALSEPESGSDPGSMRTTARREGKGWLIEGQKQWITSGDFASFFIVWARTGGNDPALQGPRGISCFIVESQAPGLSIGHHERKMGLRGSSTVALHFEKVWVPEDALLGELHGGFKIAMSALDGGRIGIAAQAIGIAEAALEEAIEYAKERRAFGRPIADYQAIQWMIADSRTELDAATLLAYRAAFLKMQGRPFTREAAMAKLFATEAAWRAVDRALQIHGGYGYVAEYDVERHYRDVRVTRIYEGTSEIQRLVIARSLLRGQI